MPKMHVKRSLEINAPVDKVYALVNDFSKWSDWSPWLIMEPGAQVTLSDDNKYYEWQGNRVGEGNMKILDEQENVSVDYDLNFLKPWKSHADVRFELESKGDNTHVTWYMDSGLPFFLFWMKKAMEAYVGMDYVRGLYMLKDLAEKGEVPSKLEFKGESDFKGFKYVGVKTDSKVTDIGNDMEKDFDKLDQYFKDNDLYTEETVPFSQYHKWDPVKDKVVYTCGFSVEEVPDNLPAEFATGELAPTRIYTLQHTGPYTHLGNAWSTMMSMERAKEFKHNGKQYHPFEIYLNDPATTAPNDLITQVNFSLK